VTYVEGVAEVKSNSEEPWVLLLAGDELFQNSLIRTDEDSYADIRIQNGSIVRVMPDTLFSLSSLSQENINLTVESGAIVSRIKKLSANQEFTFTSPVAVAGIRGTELAVQTDTSQSTVYGLSGKIEVFNPTIADDLVSLGIHQKSTVQTSSAPSRVLPMSEEEIIHFQKILDSLYEQQVLLVSNKIEFEPNSFSLTAASKQELKRIFETLQNGTYRIKIIGHTADVGDRAPQIELSKNRADSVKRYLVELGLPDDRLVTEGVGGARPVVDGTDPESQRRNRRVEFLID
jgi:outer membrane protein OmpA-like peptidoglycan-associated protein